MKMKTKVIASAAMICVAGVMHAQQLPELVNGAAAKQSEQVVSPDGRISFTVTVSPARLQRIPEDELMYSVAVNGNPLVSPSPLRLSLQGQPTLGPNMHIVHSDRAKGEDDYALQHGKTSHVHDSYNELVVELEDNKGAPGNSSTQVWRAPRRLRLEVRAFNDAIAFRYVLPEQPALREFRLLHEDTEFRMVKDATIYAQEVPDTHSQYEDEYLKLHITSFVQGDIAPVPRLIARPLLMKVPGVAWAAITEADLQGNAGTYLVNPVKYSDYAPWCGLMTHTAPPISGGTASVVSLLPHASAWRVLMIGQSPGALIESNVITSLNPAPTMEMPWAKAGKASWEWWSGRMNREGKREFTTKNMEYYVDFAADSGFPYMLVDSDWSEPNDLTRMNGTIDIPALVAYAAKKNVKIWIWAHWALLDAQLEPAMAQFEHWGVAGVKTDFLSRDDQAMVDFMYRSAETAARHHLMMDYHGAPKPTGMERTWPNVMGYEGVIGMEHSHMTFRDNPDHHVMIPFTRMLAGPMDYTPGGFRNATEESFVPRGEKPMVMGTRAHHLAMYAVYEAAVQMVSDSPDAYAGEASFQFIKDVPATWDETRYITGEPGEYIAIARRKGRDWYLGVMTNWTSRDLKIPLAFLGAGNFEAQTYADAADADTQPTHCTMAKQAVSEGSTLAVHLARGGGFAARITPAGK